METSTAGATSRTTTSEPSIQHDAQLVERHSISLRAGDLPEDGAGAIDVLRLHAQAYARARGLELTSVMARVRTPVPDPREQIIAVEFDVVVGRGDIAASDDQLHGWTWSQGAVDWWRAIIERVATPRRQRLHVRETEDGKVIEGRFGDPRRMPGDWQGGPAIRGEGIAATPAPADQRPPWMRRGEGWDEDGEGPLGDQLPPGLTD